MTLLRFDRVALVRGGRWLFEDLALELQPGDAVQVAGPNGAGKTSLLRLAAGLLAPSAGSVERAALALADDRPALDHDRTLAAALRFWTDADPTPALKALDLTALANVPVRYLSSGQVKRATLARVVASHAPLWLLDEPLNALDSEGVQLLGKAVASHLSAGGAILAASHVPLPGSWQRIEIGA